MTAILGRWYRRPHREGQGSQVRSPYEVDMATLRIKYRERRNSSGCTARAWRNWAGKAELMPEGWVPDGVDDWEPKGEA